MTEDQEQKDDAWRKSEVSAALVHLYYLSGQSFDASRMPRTLIAQMLGIDRVRLWRCIKDARESLALAEEMRKRLRSYFKDKEAKDQERKARLEKERVIANAKRREQYRKVKQGRLGGAKQGKRHDNHQGKG